MSKQKDTGGPAFPGEQQSNQWVVSQDFEKKYPDAVKEMNRTPSIISNGMTLRDAIAIASLTGLVHSVYPGPDGVSETAYEIADAMLKERDK